MLHKPDTPAWKNGYHFYNTLVLPLVSNILLHPNCVEDCQCNPQLVVYHNNIYTTLIYVIKCWVCFSQCKRVHVFRGNENYCVEYLTLGNGLSLFLNHIRKVDVSCVLQYSQWQGTESIFLHFTASVQRSKSPLFWSPESRREEVSAHRSRNTMGGWYNTYSRDMQILECNLHSDRRHPPALTHFTLVDLICWYYGWSTQCRAYQLYLFSWCCFLLTSWPQTRSGFQTFLVLLCPMQALLF